MFRANYVLRGLIAAFGAQLLSCASLEPNTPSVDQVKVDGNSSATRAKKGEFNTLYLSDSANKRLSSTASIKLVKAEDSSKAISITLERDPQRNNTFPLQFVNEYIDLIDLFLKKINLPHEKSSELLGKPHTTVHIDRAHVIAHHRNNLLSINQSCWFDRCQADEAIFYSEASAKKLRQLLIQYRNIYPANNSYAPPEIDDPEFARVYVYRVSTQPKTKDYPVYFNDIKIASLSNKTYFWRNVKPGEIKVEIKSDAWQESNNMQKQLVVEANKNYFIKFTPNLSDNQESDATPERNHQSRALHINMNIHTDRDQLKLEHKAIALNDLPNCRQLQVIQ